MLETEKTGERQFCRAGLEEGECVTVLRGVAMSESVMGRGVQGGGGCVGPVALEPPTPGPKAWERLLPPRVLGLQALAQTSLHLAWKSSRPGPLLAQTRAEEPPRGLDSDLLLLGPWSVLLPAA